MSQEKLKILKMVEEGKITAEEGFQLLEAIGQDEKVESASNSNVLKWVRIIVKSTASNEDVNVNVKLPIALFKAGLKIGEKFSPSIKTSLGEIDYEVIMKAINEGNQGEIMNIQTDEGHHIRIILE